MQKKITFLLLAFCCFAFAATSHAQKTAWLRGFWTGRAYLPTVDSQSYNLTLEIDKVKNESFEGVLKTMKPSDSSIHFDSEVKGIVKGKKFGMIRTRIIYARNDVQNKWKVVNCNNCKPHEWEFLFEKEKFVIRGAVMNCDPGCNWVTELTKRVNEFDSAEQEELYTLFDDKNKPEKSLFVTASNNKNILVPVAAAEEKRTGILNAGGVVVKEKDSTAGKNTTTVAQTKPSWEVDNGSYISQRISFAGTDLPELPLQKKYTNLQYAYPVFAAKKPALELNSSSHIVYRTPLMAAGSIELLKRNPKSPIASRTNKQMTVTTPYLILPNTWFTAANIASTAATVVVKPAEPLLPKPVSPPLPEGFTERKQAVVRTLAVNTDSIVLRVYDNGIVDGDIVSVIYNGNVIIDKLSLTGRIVELKIPVDTNAVNSLVFHAHNLGEFPPNTAKLEIIYGNKREELTVSSDLTVSSTIDIVRK